MQSSDLARLRLRSQHISRPTLQTPAEVVAWLGAVQAQDYLAALWAIGLRMRHASESTVERAIAEKTIVRTWFMRGTLHFVPASDIRWLLALMAPRMRRLVESTSRYNQLGLDSRMFARSRAVLAKALVGGRCLKRAELAALFERARIPAGGLRLSLLLQRAQADSLICYGARRDKQVTFTLLDEWLPEAKTLEREEALAGLARRYYTSRGPATLQDFVWWSGLTTADARAGLAMAKSQLAHEVIDGQTYWFSDAIPAPKGRSARAYLLPNYDEYIVGYKDRTAAVDERTPKPANPRDNPLFNNTIVIDGRVAGTWKRALHTDKVLIALSPFAPLSKADQHAVAAAAQRYADFLDMPLEIKKT